MGTSLDFSFDNNLYLIANKLTPTLGSNVKLIFKDKYGTPCLQLGMAVMTYVFSDFNNGVYNASGNIGYDFRFTYNMNMESKKPITSTWFGIEGGLISGSANNKEGFRANAYRLAFISEINNWGISFGTIRYTKKSIPVFGIRLPF